jgi:hypothetical protein
VKLYLLQRVIGLVDGKSQVVIPVRAYETQEVAKEAAQLRTQALQQVCGCRLFDRQGDIGVSLVQFLQELGIHGFQHIVDIVEVHGSDIVAPKPPSIIIP